VTNVARIPIESLNIVSLFFSLASARNPLIFPLFASKTCQIWIPREFSDRPDSVRADEPLKVLFRHYGHAITVDSRQRNLLPNVAYPLTEYLVFERGRTLPAENNALFPTRRLIRTLALLNPLPVARD